MMSIKAKDDCYRLIQQIAIDQDPVCIWTGCMEDSCVSHTPDGRTDVSVGKIGKSEAPSMENHQQILGGMTGAKVFSKVKGDFRHVKR
jgi:hypothetical protein